MKNILICLSLIFISKLAFTQSVSLKSIQNNKTAARTAKMNSIAAVNNTTLNLPFFDNFNYSNDNKINLNLWRPSNGVLISNTLPKNNIDKNVAVFDGLDSTLTPYVFTNVLKRGITDSLVSHKINLANIDLSTLSKDTNLSLTFFLQNGGNGEIADGSQGDYFKVYFKNNKNEWIEIFSRKDSTDYRTDSISLSKSYKSFYSNIYKSTLFLNTYQDSITYLKKIYESLEAYNSNDDVLQDSLFRFYSTWTGDEIFSTQNDSINFYKKIYPTDLNSTDNYKDFFENKYHKRLNFNTKKDSLDYFKVIYPTQEYSEEYYKIFFGVYTDTSFYGKLPVYYKDFKKISIPSMPSNSDTLEYLAKAKMDSIKYYQAIVKAQNKDLYDNFARYDYIFEQGKDEQFLHENFQMSFVSFGRMSGSFDNWNLDYVSLSKKPIVRNLGYLNDMTITTDFNSLFKNYSAVPINHLTTAPLIKTDSLQININSLYRKDQNNTFNVPQNVYFLQDNSLIKDENINKTISTDIRTYSTNVTLDFNSINVQATDTEKTVNYKFYINKEGEDSQTSNDTINFSQKFYNYFAYDDGSAEKAFEINGKYSELAYKYKIGQKDTITHIQMYVPKILLSNEYLTYKIKIWKTISSTERGRMDDKVLYTKSETLSYEDLDSLGFISYKIDSLISVTDSFYIGLELEESTPLYIGADLNKFVIPQNNIFYNTTGSWKNFEQKIHLMLRPVFGDYYKINLARKTDDLDSKTISIFPNPNSNRQFNISGENIKKFDLYTTTGDIVSDYNFDENTKIVKVNTELKGVYIGKITTNEKFIYKKIIFE